MKETDEVPKTQTLIVLFASIVLFVFVCFFFLTGCTYSINMVHTEGSASDLIDEDQKAEPDISPTLTIPANVL